MELNSLVGVIWPGSPMAISDEDQERLVELKKLTGDNFIKELVRLTAESDQQLIGLHVKAISSSGAKDPALREWAQQKLQMLTENLAQSQALKKIG